MQRHVNKWAVKAKITDELKALKHYAKLLLSYTDKELDYSVKKGILIEIKRNE